MKYRVTYSYLATGMEGHADNRDYGIVEASSADEAKGTVAKQEFPHDTFYGPNNAYSTREFFLGCLDATPALHGL